MEQDTSIGKESGETPQQESASERVANLSTRVLTIDVKNSSLEILAELLSMLQEDSRRYDKAMKMYLADGSKAVVIVADNGDLAFLIKAPPGHVLGKEKGHITLDGHPVTGWASEEGIEQK